MEQVNVLGVTKQVIFAGVRTDVNELMQAIIHTELNVCIDSDDCLAIDAVEKIIKKWERVIRYLRLLVSVVLLKI